MTPIKQEEIDAMKRRGTDPPEIRDAEERLVRFRRGERVAEQIRQAFAGVTLGNGIGLHQAQGIDDYESDEVCARHRTGDEREDWQKISTEELNRCDSSLCFFNAEGMRFHLPANLIADLKGEYGCGMAFILYSAAGEYPMSPFSLLTPAQRAAVRAFLLHILDDPDYQCEWSDIRMALERYWTS